MGNFVSCFRSCLYLSPHPLLLLSLFSTSSASGVSNPSCWLYPIFNILPFSLFTTKTLSPPPSSPPTNTSFHGPQQLAFARNNTSTPLISDHAIVDPSHPVPEQNLSFFGGIFDEWFGIPFQGIFLLHIFVCRTTPKF